MKTIARCKPIIILETLPTPAWLEENLFPLGYEISKQKLGRNAILTPPT